MYLHTYTHTHTHTHTHTLHVYKGDSLEHDVAGANKAGISSVFIAGGIHAGDLGLEVSGDGVFSTSSAPLSQQKVGCGG